MILFLILIILFFALYINKYLSVRSDIEILQASISDVNASYLFQKYPLIISEPLVNPENILKTLFKYLYIKTIFFNATNSNTYSQTRSRYQIIYPSLNNSVVKIIHPKYSSNENYPYIDIILKKNQILILPIYWWYKCDSNCNCIEIYDVISYLFGPKYINKKIFK